jgi:hypothetical protein
LAGGRVDHLEGLAGHGFDPLAADHEPRRLDELGYLGKYVYLGHAALLVVCVSESYEALEA